MDEREHFARNTQVLAAARNALYSDRLEILEAFIRNYLKVTDLQTYEVRLCEQHQGDGVTKWWLERINRNELPTTEPYSPIVSWEGYPRTQE